MYASLITRNLRPDGIDEALHIYREQIIPTARAQFQGFQGMYVLTDRASGQGLTIALYATEADARLVESRGQFGQAAVAFRELLTEPPVREVREVVFHDRRDSARFARVTDGTMTAEGLAQAIPSGGGPMAEAAARQPGYAGFLVALDRASGQLTGMSFWDSMAALEASEHAYYQPQINQVASATPPRRRIFEVGAQA
ncbi:MAG: hypothetical protein ACTHMR_00845 [Thermomicrobiales bacterium]